MNQMRNFFGGGAQNNMGGPSLPGPLAKFGSIMKLAGQFKQFMSNPIGAMLGNGIDIPNNISKNDPNAILNYLRNSGTMNEDAYNQSSWLANMAQGLLGGRNQ